MTSRKLLKVHILLILFMLLTVLTYTCLTFQLGTGIWMKVRLRENDETINSCTDNKAKKFSSVPASPRSAHSLTLIGKEVRVVL